MFRKLSIFIAFLISTLASGCDAERLPLNSERIQQKFGSFGIDVLLGDGDLRVSNLYSVQRGRRICRTFAIVEFVQPVDPAIALLHEKITAGASIGATFKRAGWEIQKTGAQIGEMRVTQADSALAELMQQEVPFDVAIHAYDFRINRAGREVEYASIVEVHHPDYLDVDALSDIYAPAGGAVSTQPGGHLDRLLRSRPIVTQ